MISLNEEEEEDEPPQFISDSEDGVEDEEAEVWAPDA